MSLTTWTTESDELQGRHVQQVISLAGAWKLLDDSRASQEAREFLELVQLETLRSFAGECVQDSLLDGGFAIQDIVNGIGLTPNLRATP